MVTQVNGINAPVNRQIAGGLSSRQAPVDFRSVLQGALQPQQSVRLSAHAGQRLRERNIVLGDADMQRINQAAEKVASKGGRDALVLMDKVGLILDVASRTVVTAIEPQAMRDNVFTDIDSAVFA